MAAPFIVTKSSKSIGIAILLTFLFGPIGLFYASVSGGLIMTFTPVFLVLLLIGGILQENSILVLWSSGLLIFFILTFWLINIIWAVISVRNYNKKIEDESRRQLELWNRLREKDQTQVVINTNQNSPEINISGQRANVSSIPNLQEWLRKNPGKTINEYYSKFGR